MKIGVARYVVVIKINDKHMEILKILTCFRFLEWLKNNTHAFLRKAECLLSVLLMLLTSISCNKENGDNSSLGSATFQFSIEVPASKEVSVKSMSVEEMINSFDILVFDENEKFSEILTVLQGDIATTTTGGIVKYEFIAELESSSNERTLHFVANGRKSDGTALIDYDNFFVGDTEATVMNALKTHSVTSYSTAESEISPHVMWGVIHLNRIAADVTMPTVKLIRTVASATVQVSESINSSVLSLVKFTAAGASSESLVASDYHSSDYIPSTINENVPIGYIDYVDYSTGEGYWVEEQNGKCEDLYFYESISDYYQQEGIVFILQAKYNGELCYYSFILPFEEFYFIRNHKYIFTITKVDGRGYPTYQEARSSNVSNVEIAVTDDSRFSNIVSGVGVTVAATATEVYLAMKDNIATSIFDIRITGTTSTEIPFELDIPSSLACLNITMRTKTNPFSGECEININPTSLPLVNDVLVVRDKKSGLQLEIPIFVRPDLAITNSSKSIVFPLETMKTWDLVFDYFQPTLINAILSGGASKLTEVHYKGYSTISSVKFVGTSTIGSENAEFNNLTLKGSTPSGNVINSSIILQLGED